MLVSELNLISFMESTPDGILVIDDQRLIYANAIFSAMLGYGPEELHDLMLRDITNCEGGDQADHNKPVNGKVARGRYEARFKRKDNSLCPMEITTLPGKWRDKVVTVLVMRDISERIRLETKLQELETRFAQITGSISEIFFLRDLIENRTIYISPAYEEIWKRPVSNLYQNPLDFIESIHPEDKERIRQAVLKRDLTRQNFATDQYRILWPNGEVRWIRSRSFPVLDERGQPYRVVGVVEDITTQVNTEERLHLNEMQLRQIIDLVPHSIFVKDFEGRFLLVNKAKAELHGCTVEELTGKLQIDMHLNKEQLERMHADDLKVLATNRPLLIPEEDFTDSTGHHHILQTTKIPFIPSRDGGKAILGVATDITEQKRTEADLMLSEERLIRSLHHANIGTWDWHIKTGEIFWSDLVAPLFGLKSGANKISFQTFLAAIHADDRPALEDAVNASIETGQDYDIEHRVIWPDGSIHWLHESGGVIYGANGEAERMVGVVREITRRKFAEQALLESEHKYRVIMENASDAILLGTLDGGFTDANHSATELLGYTRAELIQMQPSQIHPKEDLPVLEAAFRDLKSKGNSLYEHLVRRKNGTIINVEVAANIIESDGKKFVMGIFRDITERKRAEQQRLEQAKTQLDTLVQEVHHRIKNNLQGVTGLLRQHATKYPELRVPLEMSITQVSSMAAVHDLYSRSSNESIALCDMVRAICNSTSGLVGRTIVPRVSIEVENPIQVSNSEAVPLALILNELIFNAIKHLAPDEDQILVTVRVTKTGAEVRIINPATSLPPGFDFSNGKGLGTGLKLVKSLLPPMGCQFQISKDVEGVVAELRLTPPVVIAPNNSSELNDIR